MDSVLVTDKRRTLIFVNILISCIASSMLATALSTALPAITTDLKISVSIGQWLTSGYSLAMGITMPLTAFLITRFPTKRLYLTGMAAFIAGLAICTLAPTFPIMMCGRVLQAVGNGVMTAMAQVVLLTIYPIEKKGTIMGWYGLSVSAAPVIAPTLAGVLIDFTGWRSIFYVAIGIMVFSFIYGMFAFDNVLDTYKKKFDVISFVLSAFTFGGITLGIGNISTYGLFSVQIMVALFVGIVGGILFVYRQFHIEHPFLELRILKYREFTLSVLGSMLLYLVMMGSSVIMPVFVQLILGYSATTAGLVTLPGSLAMAVFSPMAGKMYDKLGMKKLFVAGAACMLLSNIGMIFVTMDISLVIPAALNVIRCVSIGCLMMPLVTWGTSYVPVKHMADATALLASLRTIAGAIGAAVFVGIMTMVAKNSVASYGHHALIHGLNVTFMAMSAGTLCLLMIAVFFVHSKEIY
ncbi:MAG: MDR family MFS transporter [Anaerostipes sp.]|jgi:EmrB/QacA subfamily drug resistance transporter